VFPDGYTLRPLAADDGPALAAAYLRNRTHLAPWDPVRDESFFTAAAQTSSVARTLEAVAAGTTDAWLLTTDDVVVGRVNLSNVVRGVFLSANLGYWTDHEHLGRGLATAMVEFAVRRAADLGLHRLEAGTLVHNTGSQRVLLRCGFTEIGLASGYLKIAGEWQDHLLFQRLLS